MVTFQPVSFPQTQSDRNYPRGVGELCLRQLAAKFKAAELLSLAQLSAQQQLEKGQAVIVIIPPSSLALLAGGRSLLDYSDPTF